MANSIFFSIAIDESTDNKNIAQLMIFIKTIDDNFDTCEQLFHLSPLHGNTKGIDIFNNIKCVFKKENISFKKLSAVTTDGAPAMLSPNVGVVGNFTKMGLDLKTFHCAIHQFI